MLNKWNGLDKTIQEYHDAQEMIDITFDALTNAYMERLWENNKR